VELRELKIVPLDLNESSINYRGTSAIDSTFTVQLVYKVQKVYCSTIICIDKLGSFGILIHNNLTDNKIAIRFVFYLLLK